MDPTLRREYADFLREVPLFAGLERIALAKVAGHLEAIPVQSGTVIVREGDPPDGLYLVRQGRLSVTRRASPVAGEVELTMCGPGDTFGEIGLITGEARNASVRAEGNAEVLWLEQARFQELTQTHPSVALAIAAQLVRKLRVADLARTASASGAGALATGEHGSAIRGSAPLRIVAATSRLAGTPAKARREHRLLGIVLASLALVAGWSVPSPAGLDAEGWHALAAVLATVPLFATAAVPDGAVAVFLVGAWAAGGVAPLSTTLSGFTTGTWLLTLTISTIGAATAATGLPYRLVLWAAAHARVAFRAQVAALALCGFVISPSFPDLNGRCMAAAALPETEAIRAVAAG